MVVKLSIAVGAFFLTTSLFFWVANEAQKDPYMDELFHVPQGQQYCDGNFTTWDPMITTLPGLYLASLPLLYPVAFAISGGDLLQVCTTSMLRAVNVIFALGNFYLLYLLTLTLHPKKRGGEAVLTGLALATYPVLYFFTFLYNTDPASTFFALLTYYYALHSKHGSAALIGAMAILCRQTNVVWVAFGASITMGKVLLQWTQLNKKSEATLSDCAVVKKTVNFLLRSFRHNPKELMKLLRNVLRSVWSYILVGVGFAVFVVVNDGIVVGDRSNHQPCLNFPQLFYFLFLTTFFSCMHMVSVASVKNSLYYTVKNPAKTCLFFLIAVVLVMKFMFIHEYNLADNRHYNFYFLSKLIRRNAYTKFAFIPVYWFAFLTVCKLLENKDVFWKLSFFICTTATIVPQRMIEFRYFILPYLILRLNMPMPSKLLLVVEIVFYFAVNTFTVYMFVFKPFPWAHTNAPQRFMW